MSAGGDRLRRVARDPLLWSALALAALVFGMGHLGGVFKALFPAQARPIYEQDPFPALMAAHVALVAASSAVSILVGVAAGVFVTSAPGRQFRTLVDTLVTMGQTFPPVAVLAVAVPVMGFGAGPALVALALYGLLPVVAGTVAGIGSVAEPVREAARGIGMTERQVLGDVVLPLAAPVIVAGIRVSVIINIGMAAIASTVGAKTLGSPIIVGLNGFNTAYVLQGALLVGLLAIVADLAFGRIGRALERWKLP
jgi:osmoprotectant transport system permease protein